MSKLNFIKGMQSDSQLIVKLINELAETENFPDAVTVTEKDISESLFSDNPAAEILILTSENTPAGFIVFYQSFSTTTGKRGLHLDDLYIRPEFQGKGFGKKAIGRLATIAIERGCGRFEWWTLKWNEKAVQFYENIGARQMKELRIFRLQGEDIQSVSDQLDR